MHKKQKRQPSKTTIKEIITTLHFVTHPSSFSIHRYTITFKSKYTYFIYIAIFNMS